jgi:hypothetical protein
MSVTAKKDEDEKIHRLTEMEVREVSLVDRPANKQKFLVIKRDSSVSTEIKTNDDGELTTKGQGGAGKKKSDKSLELSDETLAKLDRANEKLLSLQGAPKPQVTKAETREDDGGVRAAGKVMVKLDQLVDRIGSQESTIQKLSATVAEQDATIETLKESKASQRSGGEPAQSQALNVEAGQTAAVEKSQGVSWPMDLAAPESESES